MPGFSSYDDLITEITTNDKIFQYDFMAIGATSIAAGNWHSLARTGGVPGAVTDGAAGSGTPGAGGTALTNASGTINLGAQDPDKKALITFGGVATTACNLMLYDRLVHVSGIAGGSTGTKNVNSVALPRYTSGVGVQAWYEFTTAGSATATVSNLLSYTNQGSTGGQVGGSRTGLAAQIINSMVGPMPLAAGDTGIQSVETINIGTASTSGVIQLVLLKPLAIIPLPANTFVEKDLVLQITSLPRVFDGASLCLMYETTATTATNLWGTIRVAWG